MLPYSAKSNKQRGLHNKQTGAQSAGVSAASMVAHLPVLSDGVPHAHLPRVARGHQLVTDEEESIHGDAKAEHSWETGRKKEADQSSSNPKP